MTIQPRRFFELAVHVKLASEAMIAAARHLSMPQPRDDLIAMSLELGSIERILRVSARERASAPGERQTVRRGVSRARI